MSKCVVIALYHFVRLDNIQALRQPLLDVLLANDIKGTLLLAQEGINGTVAGSRQAVDNLLRWLQVDERFKNIRVKYSYHDSRPFYRTKVKLKTEIVTMGVKGIDPNHLVGSYVRPGDWNVLISDPEVTLIDTRNEYETQIGSFKSAITPGTHSFREFPAYIKKHFDPKRHKKVAMFCTGGIRCEKSTAYLKQLGFDQVYHLQGGILKYLEEIPKERSLWQGECFVFDQRVSVNHELKRGHYQQCHACRMPISESEMQSEHYVQGVSCLHCYDKRTAGQRQRYKEREKQTQLAERRGRLHIGALQTAD